jgi:hypothetical protein
MDRERFDGLARLLATSGSRRGALGALLGVALLGQDPGALAKRRERKDRDRGKRKRRKRRGDRDLGDCPPEVCQDVFRDPISGCFYTDSPDNQPGPGCTAPGRFCCQGTCCRSGDVCLANGCCTPVSRETTCAGKCSDVTDNCGQSVDCGACPAQTCHSVICNATHACNYIVQPNGQPGTNCAGQCCNGACCPAGAVCANDICVCNAASCPNGCCSNGPGHPGTCHASADRSCGVNGVQCADCVANENACVNGVCVCNGTWCFRCCSNGPGNPGACEPLTKQTCGIGGTQCVDCSRTCGGGCVCNTSTGQCN